MSRGSRRTVAVAAGVVVLVLVGAVAHVLLPPRQSGEVAVPADDATPEQVVTAFLSALDAHDCETAEAVVTDGHTARAAAWCDDLAGLTAVDVGDHRGERPEWSGHTAPEEVANVPVTIDPTWRPFHDDGSMEEGSTGWGYLLVRTSPSAPWRIFDQGTG